MIDALFIFCCALVILGAATTISDALTKAQRPKKRERLTVPFLERPLKADEVRHLVHQMAILDAVHPITRDSYYDETCHRVESLVTDAVGRPFWLSRNDWFNVARAWVATEGQEIPERCERLTIRLRLNV